MFEHIISTCRGIFFISESLRTEVLNNLLAFQRFSGVYVSGRSDVQWCDSKYQWSEFERSIKISGSSDGQTADLQYLWCLHWTVHPVCVHIVLNLKDPDPVCYCHVCKTTFLLANIPKYGSYIIYRTANFMHFP